MNDVRKTKKEKFYFFKFHEKLTPLCIPFLLASLRSLITLSRERGLCPFRDDDALELDESDDPLSDPLESDEPVFKNQSKRKMCIHNKLEKLSRKKSICFESRPLPRLTFNSKIY